MCALRILVAEPHLEFRTRLRNLLLESRPDVVVWDDVQDGTDLVEKARQLRPDLIVTEYSLPVVNGIEAAELIHQSNPDVPILLISLHQSPEWLAQAKATGLSGHVPKTELADKLVRAIEVICDGGTFFPEPD